MICLYICDDITNAVQSQKDYNTAGGLAPLAECMFMGQKYDMAVIYITHTLSGTSTIIRQNAQTIIATNLSSENCYLIRDTLCLTLQQAEYTKVLKRGEFVIINRDLYDKCVYATFEEAKIPGKLSESVRLKAVKKFLANVKTKPPASLEVFLPKLAQKNKDCSSADSVMQKFAPEDIEMLIFMAKGKKPLCVIYKLLGLSRTQGRRIVKRIESLGATVLYTIPTGKRGGQFSFGDITDFGWKVLGIKGILQPKAKTNGTFLHELAAYYIEASERKRSWVITFEVDFGGKRGDALSRNTVTGEKIIWQIGMSSAAREADNIKAILKLPVMQTNCRLFFVARDQKFIGQVKKLLKKKDSSGQFVNQVVYKLIADFIEV